MIPFTPKSAIYPAAGRHEILVSGTVPDEDEDGIDELRNVTVTNKELAARYREADAARYAAVANATETHKAARAALDKESFALALEKYKEDNTPRAEPEKEEDAA